MLSSFTSKSNLRFPWPSSQRYYHEGQVPSREPETEPLLNQTRRTGRKTARVELAWDLWLRISDLGSWVVVLWFAIFGLVSSIWNLWCRIFGLGSLFFGSLFFGICDLGLGSLVWNLRFGNFGLESLVWDFWLGSLVWYSDVGGTGILMLGDTLRQMWGSQRRRPL